MSGKDDYTDQSPLKTGFHLPQQCARGRTDCRSLAQIISTDSIRTFVCCGEVAEGATPDPKDKWSFCFMGDQTRDYCTGTDLRIFVDARDIAHMTGVLGMAAAVIAPYDSDATPTKPGS